MARPHKVGHILQAEGADPARDRVVIEINGVQMIIVGVSSPSQAATTAVELVEADHVALIELDGGLEVTGASQVIDAIQGAVPVGAVMFGAESITSAAAFIARYDAS
jgi:hypothetical protein